MCHAVLATVSGRYSPIRGRVLTRYSPVRHWRPKASVRLECVMHAASVHPEPGSNSLKIVYPIPEGTSPFDLNVLCTPPAFILSQDQTL